MAPTQVDTDTYDETDGMPMDALFSDAAVSPATVDQQSADPDAPYGRKPDGTPYKVSAERRAELATKLAKARAQGGGVRGRKGGHKTSGKAAPGPERKSTPNATTAKMADPDTDYREAAYDALGLPIGLLMVGGMVYKPLALDGMAIDLARDDLADVLVDLAEDVPVVRKYIDKLTTAGRYTNAINAGIRLLAQMAVNHGVMKESAKLGTVDPTTLVGQYVETISARHGGPDAAEG